MLRCVGARFVVSDEANMQTNPPVTLTKLELRSFRRLAGIMVPASAEFCMPGADDAAIFDDIVQSLGRDELAVRQALAALDELCNGGFCGLDAGQAETAAMTLLARSEPMVTALGRAVLQCYYRDDRVFLALGREARPPFPLGHELEQGDWSLLDAQCGRPRMWRDLDGYGG